MDHANDTNPDRKYGESTVGRTHDGRFTAGNPGRPVGSRNRTSIVAEALIGENVEAIVRRVIESALGNGGGADRRAILKLILPEMKERNIAPFPLPELKEPADAVKAMDAIADALRAGELTQAETLALVKVVEAFTAAIHVSNIDKRITAIEGKSK